jgi:hypothetical protein
MTMEYFLGCSCTLINRLFLIFSSAANVSDHTCEDNNVHGKIFVYETFNIYYF